MPANPRPLLVVATKNAGKLREFQRLLKGTSWRVVGCDEVGYSSDIPEDGATYEENAVTKAQAVSAATHHAAIGDDSGIEVVALNGWPGVQSARWCGEGATDDERRRGLTDKAEQQCPDDRRVRYVSAVAFVQPQHEVILTRGVCDGFIGEACGMNGFGYDPLFFSTDLQKTFGEATADEKDQVSHRARAVLALLQYEGFCSPLGYS